MSDDQLRILQIAVAEHKIRIDTMEKLLKAQNETLTELSKQLGKLQSRLTTIGFSAVTVIAAVSEPGGEALRKLFMVLV
jgi:uncharacterized coiled-coil protein SlyX